MTSKSTDNWATPQALFDKLDGEFEFTLDACALPENTKCERFFAPWQDGLEQTWGGEVIWMNPPYGRGIDRWMKKAVDSVQDPSYLTTVVALIPNRSNAPWWHDYVMRAKEIRFIRKKVPFTGPVKGVPFWGSVLVVFGPDVSNNAPKVSSYEYPRK